MGQKGAKYSEPVGEFAEELVDAFGPLGELSWKKMFGGAGIFVDGAMFALIDSDAQLHLKADDSNRAQFEAVGSERHGRMPYYSVPASILDDESALLGWARSSAMIAVK